MIYDVEAWTDMLPVFGGDSYTLDLITSWQAVQMG
ncbi:hypothetical protein HTZ85_22470 [Escherichia coli]|nr:hypothetical protein [Escherichia coli]